MLLSSVISVSFFGESGGACNPSLSVHLMKLSVEIRYLHVIVCVTLIKYKCFLLIQAY